MISEWDGKIKHKNMSKSIQTHRPCDSLSEQDENVIICSDITTITQSMFIFKV